jgi:hypothetical protein
MTESRDEWIKKRAYALWEEEGRPSGRDAAHWEQATNERNAVEKTAPHGIEVKAKRKAEPAAKTPKTPKSAANGAAAATQVAAAKRAPRKAAAAKV